jgi:hypothetical protein
VKAYKIGKVDQAKSTCLTDGYLRRALGKFSIFFSIFASSGYSPKKIE